MKWLFIFCFFSFNAFSDNLKIEFTNLSSVKGDILYLLFSSSKGFPDKENKSFRQGKITASQAAMNGLSLDGIPPGEYALSVFHDENSNAKMDTNFMGIPKEGFAFSKNPRVIFGPPSFEKTKFSIQNERLIKLKFVYF